MLTGWVAWVALFLLEGRAEPCWARVLARGTVAARKGKPFVWGRRGLRLRLEYRSGRIVLKHWKVVRFRSKKRFRLSAGRFKLLGYRHGKVVLSWRMDFPFLGETVVYSARDRKLMSVLQRHVRTTATVLVPMRVDVDSLEIRDLVTGRRTVLFRNRGGPMCRGKGPVHRAGGRNRGRRCSVGSSRRAKREAGKQ